MFYMLGGIFAGMGLLSGLLVFDPAKYKDVSLNKEEERAEICHGERFSLTPIQASLAI